MKLTAHNSQALGRARCVALLLLGLAAPVAGAHAQAKATQDSVAKATTVKQDKAPEMPKVEGTTVDRIVAIVNNDLVLDSDVREERKFSTFLPPRSAEGNSREKLIERLINRELIVQQAKQQPDMDISDEDVAKDVAGLRKALPQCKQYQCETKAGWERLLAASDLTEDEFNQRWKQRMQVLAFIEQRFKQGIRITDADIKNYYDKTFVPQYEKTGGTPPKLAAVHDRIGDVLLEQQVSSLLSDWLKSLRAQGQVVVLHPGEAAP